MNSIKTTLAYACLAVLACQALAVMPVEKSLKTFSFTNCGPSTDPFIVSLLSVQPDPIKLPGKINVDAIVQISQNITEPLTVRRIKLSPFPHSFSNIFFVLFLTRSWP